MCVNPDHLEIVTNAENIRRKAHHIKSVCKRGHPFTEATTRWVVAKSGNLAKQCKECARIKMRERRADDPERFRIRDRTYYAKNKEVHREKSRRWYHKHPGKGAEAMARYRAKKKAEKIAHQEGMKLSVSTTCAKLPSYTLNLTKRMSPDGMDTTGVMAGS